MLDLESIGSDPDIPTAPVPEGGMQERAKQPIISIKEGAK